MKLKKLLAIGMLVGSLVFSNTYVFASDSSNKLVTVRTINGVEFQIEQKDYEELNEDELNDIIEHSIEIYNNQQINSNPLLRASAISTLTAHNCVPKNFIGPLKTKKSIMLVVTIGGKKQYEQYWICAQKSSCSYLGLQYV